MKTPAFCHPNKFVKGLSMCPACYQKFKKLNIPYCPVRYTVMCHPGLKHKARGLCTNCYDKVLKQENTDYRLRQQYNSKRWLSDRPHYARIYRKQYQHKPQYQTLRTQHTLHYRLRKLGITIDVYQLLLKYQNNQCSICTKRLIGKDRHLDHCHTTNKVRGLLCHTCNLALGLMKDNQQWLQNAIQYLQKPPYEILIEQYENASRIR